MKPEAGDRKITVAAEDVAAGVRSVGVGPGDLVMFHSSLSSMGEVVGGPNTVIEGFLQAVAPGRTVAVPTLWWTGKSDLSAWDPDTSPSYPGIITETFRQRPDSVRSNNPTCQVCVSPDVSPVRQDGWRRCAGPSVCGHMRHTPRPGGGAQTDDRRASDRPANPSRTFRGELSWTAVASSQFPIH